MRPALVFTGGTLDRAAHRRADAEWIAARLADRKTRVIPVWRDLNLVIAEGDGAPATRPALLDGEAAAGILANAEDLGFLGVDAAGRAVFAAALPAADGEGLARALAPTAAFKDLGKLAAILGAEDGALLAYARALLGWHRRHRFCGSCGAPTVGENGGHQRGCTGAGCGATSFPRTDPVVIMLLTRGDACLLARQPSWMPGLYSTLAGFVEPGETLEAAVAREIREEAGIDAHSVRYVASQPWPFPQSLMVGFRAEAPDGAELALDGDELEDARWVGRGEFADIRACGIRLPFRGTIARALIEGWLAEGTAVRRCDSAARR